MTKMVRSFLMVAVYFIAVRAVAGIPPETGDATDVPNGGFIVECPSGDAQFFDHFAYTHRNPDWTPDPHLYFGDYTRIVLNLINNYAIIDGDAADELRFYVYHFWNNVTFKTYGEDPQVYQAARPWLASEVLGDCELRQMFSHVTKNNKSEYTLIFQEFEKLDEINKAISILHEVNYLNRGNMRNAMMDPSFYVINSTHLIMSYPNMTKVSASDLLAYQIKNILMRTINQAEFARYGKYRIRLRPPATMGPSSMAPTELLYGLLKWNHQYVEAAYVEPFLLKTPQSPQLLLVGGAYTVFYPNGTLKSTFIKNSSPVRILLKDFTQKDCRAKVSFGEDGSIVDCE